MFTGIITDVGTVTSVSKDDDRLRVRIESAYEDLVVGESVAVNGACLTVTSCNGGEFDVDIIVTSRGRTTFDALLEGDRVNLERALRVGDRLGGHFVQGHVDGVGEINGTRTQGDALLVDIRVPEEVAAVSVLHGSITVDGVSMTVNDRPSTNTVQISLIPHTRAATTLGALERGDLVHVEGDLLGKFVNQLMSNR